MSSPEALSNIRNQQIYLTKLKIESEEKLAKAEDNLSNAYKLQENLYLQLHETQEELEFFYLQNNKLKAEIIHSNKLPILIIKLAKKIYLLAKRAIEHPHIILMGTNKICKYIINHLPKA